MEEGLALDVGAPALRGSRSWARIAGQVECARQLVMRGRMAQAQTLASSAWKRCELRGFHGLAARCAAVLCATAEARAALPEARLWRARAIDRLLPTQDRLLANALFVHPAYRRQRLMDRELSDVLYERLCVIVPQMLDDGEAKRTAVTELLVQLFDGRVSPGAIASVARCDSAFAHYAQKNVELVGEMLALALTALTGTAFDAALDALRCALADCVSKLRPAVPRTIAIAVPKSQSAPMDHLKFDDQRSGGVEYLAGLHVRFLPLRSDTGAAHARRRRNPVAGPPSAAAGPAHSR
jgi:GNAT superfamily N-acetyltransferase